MTNVGRKIVYFLGAGASYGAGATASVQGGGIVPIPTQATFWDTFLRFCSSQRNRDLIESFLFRYFLGYARVPARTNAKKRRAMLRDVDVEEVFTFLSERARASLVAIIADLCDEGLGRLACGVWSCVRAIRAIANYETNISSIRAELREES